MRLGLCGWRRCVASIVLALGMPIAAAASAADESIVAAQDAFRAGDKVKLATQLAASRGHELEAYVEYWSLQLRLDEMPAAEVSGFLQRQRGTLVADRLRGDWLKQLGKSGRWEEFDREYPALVYGDQETTCYALQSRLARRDQAALAEARELWLDPSLPPSCEPVLEALVAAGRVKDEEVWQRLRALLETKRLSAAKATAAFLPPNRQPDAATLERIIDAPAAYLHKLKPNFAATRSGRELAMAALARLARQDSEAAARAFEPLKGKFSGAERGYIYAQLGWQGALRHQPEALAWYKAAGDTPLSDAQAAWKVRAALRAQDWRMVRDAIEDLPPQLSTQPDWIYWRGRALAALGRRDDAQLLYRSIAGQPNFYSNLASEELGLPISVPPRAVGPTREEIDAVSNTPAIRRALALFRVDLRPDAVREWSWALRGQNDRYFLASAEVAKRHQIFDRAISSADRTRDEHDYDLRYLAPFRERIEPRARELALDESWVYGLMRQESRFVMDAKSSAGARGLMQVMPATAKWLARKLGLKDFSVSQMSDMDTNVALGTQYLKLVLDGLDNHPVLASAAYNAGPNRARRWRDSRPLEGAIYVETIPLNETRDYVKKVMSNTVYYATLFEGKPQSIKARLGVIRPNGAADAVAGEDVP